MKTLLFGGGNFVRAFVPHQFDSEITIVKPTNWGDYQTLRSQGNRYHVVTRGLVAGKLINDISIIENIGGVINPYSEWSALLASAADPVYRLVVSNTTEMGIAFRAEDWRPDACPSEFPAKLTRWLYARYRHFGGDVGYGVDVLPCELIDENGAALLRCVLRYGKHWQLEAGFGDWLTRSCGFFNTLVDRIVSGYPADAAAVQSRLSFQDKLIVVAEPYHSWVIAGPDELGARLPLRPGHGVTFTDDLDKFRTLKVRILNGLHILMVAVGVPAGIETVRAFVEDEYWGNWLRAALEEEIIPALPYPTAETRAYAATVLDRFRNPYLEHRLSSIALNKKNKFAVRVDPSITDYRKKFGRPPSRLVAARRALFK